MLHVAIMIANSLFGGVPRCAESGLLHVEPDGGHARDARSFTVDREDRIERCLGPGR